MAALLHSPGFMTCWCVTQRAWNNQYDRNRLDEFKPNILPFGMIEMLTMSNKVGVQRLSVDWDDS